MRITPILAAVVLFLFCSLPAYADDEIDMGHAVAREPRAFRLVHELRVSGGVFPIDAFDTAILLGGSYTVHLSDLWAWEAVHFDYAINMDTGVQEMLVRRWSIAPALEEAELQFFLSTRALLTPFYGKLAVFNDGIIYVDAHLSMGGGLAHYTDGFRAEVSGGPGIRFFLGSLLSVRLDVALHLIPNAPGGTDLLAGIDLSLASTFGRIRVSEEEAPLSKKKIVDGLRVLDELYPKTTKREEP